MSDALNAPGRRGLVANLVAWVGAAVALNGLVFGLGWTTRAAGPRPWFAPPGWAIGAVWVGLFALLATARWTLHARPDRRGWVTGLLLLCLAFPVYAQAPGSRWAAFAGSAGTGLVALVVVGRAAGASPRAAGLVAPTAVWCGFATLLTAAALGLVAG